MKCVCVLQNVLTDECKRWFEGLFDCVQEVSSSQTFEAVFFLMGMERKNWVGTVSFYLDTGFY